MHDLRGNYILSLSSLFSYVSAKLRNALPDFIRKYELTGFKRESRASSCTAAFLLMNISLKIMYLKLSLEFRLQLSASSGVRFCQWQFVLSFSSIDMDRY